MFHRVKSETPSPQQFDDTAYEDDAQDARDEEQSFEEEEAEAEEETAEAEEEVTQTKNEKTEEKDTQKMTDRTETATREETRYAGAAPSMYGRPAQPAMRAGGYPGAYPGAAASYASTAAQSAPAAKEREVQSGERTLTIGAGITMSGEIEACDSLVIEGTVEAALKGARSLEIAETGTFFGSVEIEEATIAGRFEGELTVRGRLTLRSGGVITGAIVYGELEIEAGSLIDGRLTPIAAGQSQMQKAPSSAKGTSAKAKVGRAGPKSAANSDGELFAAEA